VTTLAETERLARVRLNVLTEPGDVRVSRLVLRMGAVALAHELGRESDLLGLRDDVRLREPDLDPERILDRAHRDGIRYVVPGDAEWPAALDDLDTTEPVQRLGGRPLGLWVRGPLRLDEVAPRSVALVGSRSATTYGVGVAGDLAAHVAAAGHPVVSGAAFGIDQAAHRGALGAGGPTVAVLACGADRAYPSAHRPLLDHLAAHGAVVSELRPGLPPTRVRFLARNRLIAAMSQGTVVVEAAVRSGALNTANWAGRLGRVLMGVPGPVTSAPSEGVHELVRTGEAALVTRGEHVLECLAPVGTATAVRRRAEERPVDALDLLELRVLDAVPLVREAPSRSIAHTAGLDHAETRRALRKLAGLGAVEQVQDRWRRARENAGDGAG
jgi:DNA processing protein